MDLLIDTSSEFHQMFHFGKIRSAAGRMRSMLERIDMEIGLMRRDYFTEVSVHHRVIITLRRILM